MGIGAPELVIVLLIILLIFGGSKLPQLARSLGSAQKEFKEGTREANAPAEPTAVAPPVVAPPVVEPVRTEQFPDQP